MAARVVFTSGFSRRYTGGVREFTVEAKNLRGVIKEMDRLYPGLGEHLEEETTVAIDGQLHETAYFQPIREFQRSGTQCRDFTETTYRGDRQLTHRGTACRASDGQWRFD